VGADICINRCRGDEPLGELNRRRDERNTVDVSIVSLLIVLVRAGGVRLSGLVRVRE
jgi:hypothetical protein